MFCLFFFLIKILLPQYEVTIISDLLSFMQFGQAISTELHS